MNNRPSGDNHWTRARPELRTPWTKLGKRRMAEFYRRLDAGESQSSLARAFRIGRTTAWRYAHAQR